MADPRNACLSGNGSVGSEGFMQGAHDPVQRRRCLGAGRQNRHIHSHVYVCGEEADKYLSKWTETKRCLKNHCFSCEKSIIPLGKSPNDSSPTIVCNMDKKLFCAFLYIKCIVGETRSIFSLKCTS